MATPRPSRIAAPRASARGVNLCRGVLCQPADVCNFAGVCDFQTGQCNQSARPDGTACDDGNKKTIDDVCQAGVCKGVPACPTSTLIYVLSDESELYSFYPPTLTFRRIGTLSCTNAATPYSMAVGRDGIGYSVFTNGELFQVDTRTAACSSTAYAVGQQGFTTFGMGFTADTDPTKDALYVIDGPMQAGQSFSKGLGRIRTDTMELDFIGAFVPSQFPGELTGAADGKLYGMHHDRTGSGHFLTEIEPSSGKVQSSQKLQVGSRFSALAFSFWGGMFWVFTSDRGASGSTITRYDPSTKVETNMGVAPAVLVGAGVSPCND